MTIPAAFEKLMETLDRLLGPNGCPWDRAQTMQTLRTTVLEETCELIEAIDLNNNSHIKDELGDLLLNAVFLCKLAEKESRFEMVSVIENLNDKLIRRHPHIFGDAYADSPDAVVDVWNAVKAKEKTEDTHILDSLPKGLPSLMRAQKALKRLKKAGYARMPAQSSASFDSEEALGNHLMEVCMRAGEQKLDAEIALRKVLTQLESQSRGL